MRRSAARAIARVAMGGIAVIACTTTYTEADLEEEERRQSESARSEEVYDRELGEEGGANLEALEEDRDRAIRESER